jgi:predicted PurR-regulated permease PerM
VSHWAEVFLGVIAVSTLTTSIILIALLVAAARLARRVDRLVQQIEQEIKPAFAHLNAIARDAARAAALAAVQVERVDRLFGDVAERVGQVLSVLQNVVAGPMRNGSALSSAFVAFRTVLSVIRDLRGARSRSRADDEDALFI